MTNLYKFAMIRNSFSTLKINYFVVQKQDLGYLKSILNPGDEVIIFAPFFGEYINYVNKCFPDSSMANSKRSERLGDCSSALKMPLAKYSCIITINI